MKLFVGLGNPGKQYEGTRHNLGFIALDKFSDMLDVSLDRTGFKGEYCLVKDPRFEETIILLKPMTFMNLSGESVREISDYFKIDPSDIVIIFDDMALPVGKIRLREKGSHGGHNGMKNIIEHMGTDEIKRIRIGIGEPEFDAIDYVLGKPKQEDMPLIEEATDNAARAVRDILLKGFKYAMDHYNREGGPDQ